MADVITVSSSVVLLGRPAGRQLLIVVSEVCLSDVGEELVMGT